MTMVRPGHVHLIAFTCSKRTPFQADFASRQRLVTSTLAVEWALILDYGGRAASSGRENFGDFVAGDFHESLHYHRIKLRSGRLVEAVTRLLRAREALCGSSDSRSLRHKGVDHSYDARPDGNFVAFQIAGIAAAVETFVMMKSV